MTSFTNIIDSILKRLNTTTATLIGLFTLVGMGYGTGVIISDVISKGEMKELNAKHTLEIIELRNKHTLEIIELRDKHTVEIIELQKRINLLEINNEKRKKESY